MNSKFLSQLSSEEYAELTKELHTISKCNLLHLRQEH